MTAAYRAIGGFSLRPGFCQCETCGFMAAGTINGMCIQCQEEERVLDGLRRALRDMEARVESDRARRRGDD